MKILGLIPARSGSKGVKDKNIIKIKNKRLIEYTFSEVLKSKLINKIVLSTNCKKVMRVKKKYDRIKLIKRPDILSKDSSSIFNVIKHTLNYEKQKLNFYDYLVLLQPTTPLKNAKMIDDGIKKIVKEKGSSLVSVYEVDDNHPARMYKIKSKKLIPISKKNQQKNRQRLEKIYHRDGNLYIFSCKNFTNKNIKNYYGNKIVPLVLSKNYKLNIDTYLDLELAKLLIK